MIWLWLAAALTSAALAVLIVQRAARAAQGRPGDNPALAVYRRQMAELDELAERGVLAEGERRSVRSETGRRLLAAAERPEAPVISSGPRTILVVAAAVPPIAGALYLLLGAPQEPKIAAAPAPTAGPTRVANAAPTAQSDGFFSNLARKVGIGGTADATATESTAPPPPAKPKVIEAKRTEPPRQAAAPKAETKQAAARPALKPSVSDTAAAAPTPAPASAQVAGSAPIVSSNSFDSRCGAVK